MRGRRIGSYLGWVAVIAVIAGLIYGLVSGTFSTLGAPRVGEGSVVKERRLDTDEAITKEMNARFKKVKQSAEKLITYEDGKMVLHHKYGTTVIPDKQDRIVVIRMEDPMYALEAPMVGAYNRENFYLHDELEAQGVQHISINEETKTINLEQIEALKPDLIIMRDSFTRSTFDALSKIAPTAAFELQDAERALLTLGMVLHREKQAEARLHKYYGHVKEARMAIKSRIGDSPLAYIRVMKKEIRLYPYSSSVNSRFIFDLLNITPDTESLVLDGKSNNAVSYEMLPDIDAKYLLVSTAFGASTRTTSDQVGKELQDMQSMEIWHTIPAVQEGHVHMVSNQVWSSHGIIAKERAIDELRAWLAP